MKFYPQQYKLPDVSMQPFLDDEEIWDFINQAQPTKEAVHAVVEKSLNKNRLSLAETALLLNAVSIKISHQSCILEFYILEVGAY